MLALFLLKWPQASRIAGRAGAQGLECKGDRAELATAGLPRGGELDRGLTWSFRRLQGSGIAGRGLDRKLDCRGDQEELCLLVLLLDMAGRDWGLDISPGCPWWLQAL